MVAVNGKTVRTLRLKAGLTERGVAAAFDGRTPGAAQQFLRRLERNESAELTVEESEALASALGVDVNDLEREMLWTYVTPNDGIVDIGTYAVGFSDAQDAQDRRTFVSHLEQKAVDYHLVPVTRDQLVASLYMGDAPRDAPVSQILWVDPETDDWIALLTLENVLRGITPEEVDTPSEKWREYVDAAIPRLANRINLLQRLGLQRQRRVYLEGLMPGTPTVGTAKQREMALAFVIEAAFRSVGRV